jgi:hypothetical protein
VRGLHGPDHRVQPSWCRLPSSTAGFWTGIATAQQQVISNLYLPANAAFINSADWGWISATVDTSGRPLLLPHTAASDALARVAQESFVAQLGGLSLIVDPSVPSGKVVVRVRLNSRSTKVHSISKSTLSMARGTCRP